MTLKAYCFLALIATALGAAGCAGQKAKEPPRPKSNADAIWFESSDLRVTLIGILGMEHEGTLAEDPGWLEYVLDIDNRGRVPLTVRNVKLLNLSGRYIDSAASYDEITAPPNPAYEIAGGVATSAAGTVAGQLIPYGGYIVQVISGAASASAAETRANSRRVFALRVLKDVELAPAGVVAGSAFLPKIPDAKALVIEYDTGDGVERIELTLPVKKP